MFSVYAKSVTREVLFHLAPLDFGTEPKLFKQGLAAWVQMKLVSDCFQSTITSDTIFDF